MQHFRENLLRFSLWWAKAMGGRRQQRSVKMEASRIDLFKNSTGPSWPKSHAGGASPAFRYRLTAN
ncbi:MAG TPA: hypothetical protein PKH05_05575, partial [Nitrospira sp.]|nr:hypothetical protein [Nitrospira sp.]